MVNKTNTKSSWNGLVLVLAVNLQKMYRWDREGEAVRVFPVDVIALTKSDTRQEGQYSVLKNKGS